MTDVVITGLGPVCSLGAGMDMLMAGIEDGEANAYECERFDDLLCAPVDDFDVKAYLLSRKNYLDPQTAYAFGAVSLALADAGLNVDDTNRSGIALCWGTAYGSMGTMDRYLQDVHAKGPRFAKPILFPHTYGNTAISLLSIEYGLTGYHQCYTSGWQAGAHALHAGLNQIIEGNASVAIVGASEGLTTPLIRHLNDAQVSEAPLSEGGAAIVLETRTSAEARGATIHSAIRVSSECTAEPVSYRDILGESFSAMPLLDCCAAAVGKSTCCVEARDPKQPSLFIHIQH